MDVSGTWQSAFYTRRPWVGRFPMVTLSWMDEGWFAEYETALERNPPRYAIFDKVKLFYFNRYLFFSACQSY